MPLSDFIARVQAVYYSPLHASPLLLSGDSLASCFTTYICICFMHLLIKF